jgi:uncharacterized glyoxalase superfamily protein PhnB
MAPTPQTEQPRPAAVPYLAVRGAHDAIDWYGTVFGAVIEGEPYENDDGSIGHVALRIADGVIYLADEAPDHGAVAPTGPGAAVSLMLPVPDVAATLAEAVREGALPDDRGVYEGYGSRNAWFVDPFGHRWGISSPHG